MYVAALAFKLHLPDCRSLKEKRALVRPVVEGLRRRFGVSAAEIDSHDKWQRASVAIAVVASTEAHVTDILDRAERFVWSFPELEVLECQQLWLEER